MSRAAKRKVEANAGEPHKELLLLFIYVALKAQISGGSSRGKTWTPRLG